MARILVLDGHSSAALSVTRSAGRAGHWVAVGANRGLLAPAALSRYCSASLAYPVSTSESEAFVDAILEFVRAHTIDLVIPVTDWTLGPLSAQRQRFAGICRVAMPLPESLELASDKYGTVKLAESIGIDVPRTVLAGSNADLAQFQDGPFPVVVKDRFSVRWINGKAVFGSVAYAYSAAELEGKVSERVRMAGDVLVQEFTSGAGVGFSCFVTAGKAYLPFQWQRIREVDPRGSASSARKSVPLDPSVVSRSARLIVEMGFEGIAMVEYKKTDDGRLILMEINGRPWGSIGLPVACGIDYPKYLVDWWMQGTLPPQETSYRNNVICRRVVGELTHLSNIRAGRPPKWPGAYPSFWPSLLTMALPWRPGMCYDDLWLSDLRPGAAGVREWFLSRWRKKKN
ncbi:MAG TPA: ATP-grasp domain-containing protein [Candidatus Sulfotelmatobacter sp.]